MKYKGYLIYYDGGLVDVFTNKPRWVYEKDRWGAIKHGAGSLEACKEEIDFLESPQFNTFMTWV